MTLFCAISDTHNKHSELKIPESDVLIHAGDFSSIGRLAETKAFLKWFSEQKAAHKIFISGNHDLMDYENPSLFKELLKEYPGITYLRDEGTEVNGIKIWGRACTPTFGDWAFMADRGSPRMLSTLSVIPNNIDILITHGPAAGILDVTLRGESVGCYDLLNELDRIQPQVLICGHIHQSSGIKEVNGVKHINAAVLDDYYKVNFEPKLFSLTNNKK